jgi:sugar diacid utilization regulator
MPSYAAPPPHLRSVPPPAQAPPALAALRAVFLRPHLRDPRLAALRDNGTDLAGVLRAHLDTLGSAPAAAERLGIPVNTYRYRLRRLLDGTLDLSDPDVRLVCGLEVSGDLPDPGTPAAAGERYAAVAFRVDGDAGPGAEDRLARVAGLTFEAFRTAASFHVAGPVVYATVALGGSTDRVLAVARRAANDAECTLRARVLAGVGPAVTGAAAVSGSRDLAEDVLDVVAARGGGVASLDEVRTAVVLRALGAVAAERPGLFGDGLSRLAAQDAEHGTAYVGTLRAYLDAFGDVAVAARRVCVHAKTLRYRLRRIAEVAGLDLTDPDARLAAHLELRLR